MIVDAMSRRIIEKVSNLRKASKKAIRRANHTSGNGLVKATSTEILRKPKGGRTYVRRTRSGARRKHVASAPGETHANMTGALRRSLGFRVSVNELEFGYGVEKGNAPDYAKTLEFGGSKMKARPSLQNGIKSQRRNIMNNIEREIKKELEL